MHHMKEHKRFMNLHDKHVVKTVVDWLLIDSAIVTSFQKKWFSHLLYTTDTSGLRNNSHY